jgi:DMSO/TMAO reductase YedYZ molybdopterin-dependent catalytic subunit/mono/diheme cytochrome c family protein
MQPKFARILASGVVLAFVLPTRLEGAELLRQHLSRPYDAESTMSALSSWETPIEGFFVRAHFDVPQVDYDRWTLRIDGLVDHPLTLTLKDLRKMPAKSLHAVLECSGNGRGEQQPTVPGVQWTRGAVGNAGFTGVPLKELLAKAGVKAGGRFIAVQGADQPARPSIPGFIRSVPLAKALAEDTLIALTMNGAPMPPLHGGPLRLVLPNWYGENWMKWLTRITVTAQEDEGFFMKKAYRMPKEPVNPGDAWDSATGAPIEQVLVQSLIVEPQAGQVLAPGDVEVSGKAFSGAGAIAKVDLSTDGGRTWLPAEVEPRHADGGWQAFRGKVKAPAPGSLTILSRATDAAGATQPAYHTWNPAGYLRNAIDQLSVTVAVQAAPAGLAVMEERCLVCHDRGLIESQRLTEPQWQAEVAKMQKAYGVVLPAGEVAPLVAFLTRFGPEAQPAIAPPGNYGAEAAALAEPAGKGDAAHGGKVFGLRCAACHGAAGEGDLGPRLKGRAIGGGRFRTAVLHGRRTMPAYAGQLAEKDVADLAAYLR